MTRGTERGQRRKMTIEKQAFDQSGTTFALQNSTQRKGNSGHPVQAVVEKFHESPSLLVALESSSLRRGLVSPLLGTRVKKENRTKPAHSL